MPAFSPCIGTRAQVDARPVCDGQFLIAADTGEAFIDFNGVRVQLCGQGGSGVQPQETGWCSALTDWIVVNSSILVSDSVKGGGPGAGIFNAPDIRLLQETAAFLTSYPVVNGLIRATASEDDEEETTELNTPDLLLPQTDDVFTTRYAVVEGRLLVSGSVPGGGPGNGILATPAVVLNVPDNSLATTYTVVSGRLLVSESVQGGGPGNGVANAPSVAFVHEDNSLKTTYTVVNGRLLISDSVPGGGPGEGVLNAPAVEFPVFTDELETSYSVTEA